MANVGRGWPQVTYESHPWVANEFSAASRTQRLASRGPYEAAVPPFIERAIFVLPAVLQAATEDAANELARFDTEVGAVAAPFSTILLRSESASSSEIENLTSGAKQIAIAQLGEKATHNAELIVGNVRALEAAVRLSGNLTDDAIIEMHRALLEHKSPEMVGQWRDDQVWIGGGNVSPHLAQFVPPHHDRVPGLMSDLMAFARRTDLPLLAQIAVAHAQFETVHPFPDGNGRTGRALIQSMLRAGGATRTVSVPVSAGLLQDVDRYFAALTSYRQGEIEAIVSVFADACFAGVRNGRQLVADIQQIRAQWASIVKARAGSSASRMLDHLLGQPVVNSTSTADRLGVSTVAAQQAINTLVDAGILTQFTAGKRNRLWQAREVIEAMDSFAARAQRRRG